MKKEQQNLFKRKAFESFKLIGFSIMINVFSALISFVAKISKNIAIDFFDDWLLKVIIPISLIIITFGVIFLVKWREVVIGDYGAAHLNNKELEQLFNDSITIRKVYDQCAIDEKRIQLKRLIYMIKYCFIIEIIGERSKLKKLEKDLFLKTHSFIHDNISIFDKDSDVIVEWELLNQDPDYTRYVR